MSIEKDLCEYLLRELRIQFQVRAFVKEHTQCLDWCNSDQVSNQFVLADINSIRYFQSGYQVCDSLDEIEVARLDAAWVFDTFVS